MIGLIKKDLLFAKQNTKAYIIILLVFIIMSLDGSFSASYFLPFLATMFFVSTFSYDDFNNWNPYAISFPCGRKNIVKAKYFSGLIFLAVSIVISVLVITITSLFADVDFNLTMSYLIGCVVGTVFAISVMFPLIFKYGAEKGRIYLFVCAFLVMGIITAVSKIINVSNLSGLKKIFENFWFIIIPILIVGSLIISYNISKNIFLKKEF